MPTRPTGPTCWAPPGDVERMIAPPSDMISSRRLIRGPRLCFPPDHEKASTVSRDRDSREPVYHSGMTGFGATEPFGTGMTEVRNPTLNRLLNRPVGPGFVSSPPHRPPLGTHTSRRTPHSGLVRRW